MDSAGGGAGGGEGRPGDLSKVSKIPQNANTNHRISLGRYVGCENPQRTECQQFQWVQKVLVWPSENQSKSVLTTARVPSYLMSFALSIYLSTLSAVSNKTVNLNNGDVDGVGFSAHRGQG